MPDWRPKIMKNSAFTTPRTRAEMERTDAAIVKKKGFQYRLNKRVKSGAEVRDMSKLKVRRFRTNQQQLPTRTGQTANKLTRQ